MRKATGLMAAGHAGVDFYQGLLPVLVPFLVFERGLGYGTVSTVVLAGTASSAAAQPLFGWWADHRPVQLMVPIGMLACGTGTLLLGATTALWPTIVAAAVIGLGVAAYHPPAARLARTVTGGGPKAMSWFSLGGNLGFVAAPALAGPVLAWWGLASVGWFAVPALLGVLTTLPFLTRSGAEVARPASRGTDDWPSFLRLTTVVVFRSIAALGLAGFAGLYAVERLGRDGVWATAAVFALYLGGGIGTVLGGRLAARRDRVRVVRWGYLATAAALPLILVVPGPGLYPVLLATGTALAIPFSLHITLGQDYLPTRPGTASGVTLGLAVSAGGLLLPALAAIAEAADLSTALATLTALPIAAWLLSLTLREPPGLGSDHADVRIRRKAAAGAPGGVGGADGDTGR